MRRRFLISSLILLVIPAFARAATLRVRPGERIQPVIDAANHGDTIIVDRDIYSGPGNRDLDFAGKAITLQSNINPNALRSGDWDTIANTIIDCGGTKYKPHRAFNFHSGEGYNSKVIGFTIINGYINSYDISPEGQDAADANGVSFPWCAGLPIDPADPLSPPRACSGDDVIGNGYGGAIRCSNASPTIKYCIIRDCTVTGAKGGDGANGVNAPWVYPHPDPNFDPFEMEDGQWGGHGGRGFGDGYGGAIACLNNSSPRIIDCTLTDNFAKGGVGGRGGNGGRAAGTWPDDWDGYESGSGNGGDGWGDGIGGAIYCSSNSNAKIESSLFVKDIARQGVGGLPGIRGLGNPVLDLPGTHDPIDGSPGRSLCCSPFTPVLPGIHGGAAFFDGADPDFTDCEFTDNAAYIENEDLPGIFSYDYKNGGAIYARDFDIAIINRCNFTNNRAGALYLTPTTTSPIHIINNDPNKGLFSGNTEALHGGAVFIGPGSNTVDISGCSFAGNWAYENGGALWSMMDLSITNCSFGGNKADFDNNVTGGNGGAIELFGRTIEMTNCSFAGNQAVYGGGVHFTNFAADLVNCHFSGNTAEFGGGLSLRNGVADVNGGSIKNNNATYISGYGGGLEAVNTELKIRDCTINANSALGDYAYGGGLALDGGPVPHLVSNCLFTNNAADTGGAISCTWSDANAIEVESCTFYSNSASTYGGGVFVDHNSSSTIINSIFNNCSSAAIYEEEGGGDATVTYTLFFENPDGDYYDSGTGQVYSGGNVADPYSILYIPGGSDNLYGDPLFIDPLNHDPDDDFLLSQKKAGQSKDSPAVDAGSVDVNDLGFDPLAFGWDPRRYTTRTDGRGDVNDIDLGYHYRDIDDPIYVPAYTLTTQVLAGSGTLEVDPNMAEYPLGTLVELTAVPTPGWFVKAWYGTDDDSITATTNTVTMTFDRTVLVEFRQPRTFTVGSDPNYPTIESAIFDAQDGDIVVVPPGIWYGPEIRVNKSITLRAVDPNDPTVTIIDRTGYANRGIVFGTEADSGTVLDGFTIQNCWYRSRDGWDGDDVDWQRNGEDGWGANGGAIFIYSGASPVIKNCILRDNRIRGGHGGEGSNATTTENAGRGGWGGWSRGAGVYCAAYSSPKFINCQIIDNHAVGGDGAFGGDYLADGGEANYGGNWSKADWYNYDSVMLDWVWEPGNLWEAWVSTPWWPDPDHPDYGDGPSARNDYYGDYRRYTGYGGGAYCSVGSNVTFIDCTISGNRTSGGNSGEGGDRPGQDPEPEFSYQLPSYGGGVYCAADANTTFIDCSITDNIAQDPNEYYHLDPYLGHGGGVCAEDSALVTFRNCRVSGNSATYGGGVFWDNANPRVIDSIFTNNTAYNGGGLKGIGGPAVIIGCDIIGNNAGGMVTDPNGEGDPEDYDPNNDYYLPGDGGGIHCDSTQVAIIDSSISYNTAGGAGGGVYFTGETTPELTNCLLMYNTADKGGGAVAAHFLAQPTIANCTMAYNSASGTNFTTHYGGGLYSFDNANVSVINSILWNNSSQSGPQIAISQAPAGVDVTYSDIQGGAVSVFVGTGCVLNWDVDPYDPAWPTNLAGTTQEDPDFVHGDLGAFGEAGGFFLKQTAAGDDVDSPCVDTGSDNAHALDMYRHTTRTDGIIDGYDYDCNCPDAIVDIGYHYVLRADLLGDFNYDGIVDVCDLRRFLDPNLHWLAEGCEFPDFCHGMDLNKDGRVNFRDYALFGNNYKIWEDTPPRPDPMTWATPPYSSGDSEITMVATKATDNSTVNVQYQFDCVLGDCYDRDWGLDPNYRDTGLATNVKYGYKVRARDDAGNETDWSFIGYAITGEAPPQPPAAPGNLQAVATAYNTIELTWSDNSGNEIGVRIERRIGSDSFVEIDTVGIDTTGYSDTTVVALTTYTYRVRAYNNVDNSGYSNEASVTTPEEGAEPSEDTEPPITNPDADDPYKAEWEVWPRSYYDTDGHLNHTMTAWEAADETAPVEYYFKCVNNSIFDSGWQTIREYTYTTNQPNCYYSVITRDSAVPSNAGHWSDVGYTGGPGAFPPEDWPVPP